MSEKPTKVCFLVKSLVPLLIFPSFERQRDSKRQTFWQTQLQSTGPYLKCPQLLGLDQSKARIQKLK